jgi:glycosyltransferase involved in cell wall biosynthesis
MRIATNVTRDYLGGITRSNVSFLNFIHGKGRGIIGVELNGKRYMRAPTIFQHLSADWFNHHIINIHDIPIYEAIYSSGSIKDLERKYRPIINLIKDIFKKDKPDVVFLNGTYYIPWLISIAAHELKIPIVLRYAGIYSKETENAQPKAKKFFNQIEKSFQKRVEYFIFPSRLCKEIVEKEIIKKEIEKAFIVPNPFNIPTGDSTFKSVERRIAAIGRWDGIKNFEAFFKIHKELTKDGWAHEASFVTSDSKIRNMPKSINRFSSMTHEELLKFYSAQGLIICPSKFETFGNVPMEAVCMGVPVLVSENMGCAEILKGAGLENMVISFDDMDKVCDRVKKLCGQQILPKQINNLRKILDPQVINAELISILRSAVEKN